MAKKRIHKSSKKKKKANVSLKKERQHKEIRTDICAIYIRLYPNEEQGEQRSETSIKNELPLSSGSRDVEIPSAGAAFKQPSKVPMNRQSKCDGK